MRWTASLETIVAFQVLSFFSNEFLIVWPQPCLEKWGNFGGAWGASWIEKENSSSTIAHWLHFPNLLRWKIINLFRGRPCNWSAVYPPPIFSKIGGDRVPQPFVWKFWKKYWDWGSMLCLSIPSCVVVARTVLEIIAGEFWGNSPIFLKICTFDFSKKLIKFMGGGPRLDQKVWTTFIEPFLRKIDFHILPPRSTV